MGRKAIKKCAVCEKELSLTGRLYCSKPCANRASYRRQKGKPVSDKAFISKGQVMGVGVGYAENLRVKVNCLEVENVELGRRLEDYRVVVDDLMKRMIEPAVVEIEELEAQLSRFQELYYSVLKSESVFCDRITELENENAELLEVVGETGSFVSGEDASELILSMWSVVQHMKKVARVDQRSSCVNIEKNVQHALVQAGYIKPVGQSIDNSDLYQPPPM